MILYINTTLEDNLEVALYDKNGDKAASLIRSANRNESEKLLKTVDEVLGDKTPIGIIVVKGLKGRFSAIRAGVVCANALGFAWGVPVLGIESVEGVKGAIKRINKVKMFKRHVMPIYEKAPNLGVKAQSKQQSYAQNRSPRRQRI